MRTSRPVLAIVAMMSVLGCSGEPAPRMATSPKRVFEMSVTTFGAVGDGATMNTRAVQATIDKVASSGGGTVVVTEGVFLSGAVFLRPGVNLRLERGAVLKGSENIADYPMLPTRIEGHSQTWVPALVNADGTDHFRISGEGALDGSGKVYWAAFREAHRADGKTKNLDIPRPRLLLVQNSADVQISGIHLRDSGFWNLHLYRCRDVLIDGVDIRDIGTPPNGSPSTDGIDVDSSQFVAIRNCYIANGDDCIALKGSKGPFAMKDEASPPVEHIRISGCTFAAGGGITCGSEATVVRDVVVEDCKFIGTSRGIKVCQLKLRPDTPQLYEDIHYRNITLDGAGLLFSVAPWRQYFDLMGQPQPTRTVRNVTMTHIRGKFGGFGSIQGNEGDAIENFVLDDVDVTLANPNARIVGVSGLTCKNVKINGAAFSAPK